ncbi:hypothetical protein JVU11DRAFT_11730 [Chiua virens]|nr:hypothetical protein JVU11DRAFT_11730 [Chiua virens]
MTTSAPPTVVIPATPSSCEILVRLFLGVKPPPSLHALGRMPNCGPEATAALLKVLRDNHERSHVFFNEFSFHNHSVHHLLAIYALGAPAPVINAAYEDTHLDHLRVTFVAPNKVTITDDTFTDYLGNDHYYNAYLDYFHRVVLQPGIEQPEMLNRFLEILIHPIIHVGYGVEFGIMGLIAEGLAWTSVHPAEPEWMPKAGSRLRALNILTLMLRDPRFFGSRTLDKHEFAAMLESHGEIFVKYGELWDCQIETQEDLEARMEELIWAATLMYGVGSWDGNEAEYRADFFTAHIVTSVLFIPTICAYLSRESQRKLLRAHFLTSITWWVVRGRPSFALKDFTSRPLPPVLNAPSSKYSNTLPGTLPTPAACALSSTSPYASNANPWYAILADALVHPNEHLCKVQRALAHFNLLYGHREAGFVLESLSKDGVDVNPEYGYLDGSVFLRTAWLTAAALGWVTHGEENTGAWNYQEFQKAALEELELMKGQGRA